MKKTWEFRWFTLIYTDDYLPRLQIGDFWYIVSGDLRIGCVLKCGIPPHMAIVMGNKCNVYGKHMEKWWKNKEQIMKNHEARWKTMEFKGSFLPDQVIFFHTNFASGLGGAGDFGAATWGFVEKKQMDGWTDRRTDGWMDGRTDDGWMDGPTMDGRTDGRTDGWMDGWTFFS